MNFHPKPFWYISSSILVILLVSASPSYSFSYKYKGMEIIPHVSVRESYDDNVTYSKDNRVSDAVTGLTFGVGLKEEGKTHSLLLDAAIEHELFASHSSFNNTSEELNLKFKTELSKYNRLEVVDKFTHAEDARSFNDAFGRTAGRYSSYINQAGLSFTHDFTQRLSEEIHYGNAVNYYSRPDIHDAFLNQVGTKINYTHDSSISFNLAYDFIRRDFEDGGHATVNSVAPGIRRYFTPQFYIDLAAGPDFINSFTGKNYIKPHYFAALTDQINENTSVSWTFNKQDTTNAYTQDLFDSWRTAINFSRKINQRLNGTMGVFYGDGRYESLDVSESLTGIQSQLDYAINPATNLEVGYSFTDANSNSSGNEYRRNYFYLSAIILF